MSKLNQIYKKENYIVVPIENKFIVININKVFKDSYTNVKNIGVARLLIDLAITKELPRNPYFVDNLIRISVDKNYIKELKEFKEDAEEINYKRMMEDVPVCRRINGAIRRVR